MLLMYFTKASATTLPVLVAFLSLTLGEKKEQEHVKIAFCAVSLLALLVITVPLACSIGFAGRSDSGRRRSGSHSGRRCQGEVHAAPVTRRTSPTFLILTVVILAVLLNPAYVAPTSPGLLLSFLLVGITVYTVETEPLLRWRNVLDHKHATDYTFVFNVSSEALLLVRGTLRQSQERPAVAR